MENDSVKFKNFSVKGMPDFPSIGAVYIVSVKIKSKQIPFYVGQSGNLRRRVGEYFVATRHASADFKVGTVIQYFQDSGYKITIYYHPFIGKRLRMEEQKEIALLNHKGFKLLNNLRHFDVKKIKKFCNNVMTHF